MVPIWPIKRREMNELILAEKATNWLRLKSLVLGTDYKTVVQPRAERIHRVVWTGAAAGASPPAGGPTGPGWRRGPTSRDTIADVPDHAGVPGEVSGRHRRQGRNPAPSAAAAHANHTNIGEHAPQHSSCARRAREPDIPETGLGR
jgi:hypothetical protein